MAGPTLADYGQREFTGLFSREIRGKDSNGGSTSGGSKPSTSTTSTGDGCTKSDQCDNGACGFIGSPVDNSLKSTCCPSGNVIGTDPRVCSGQGEGAFCAQYDDVCTGANSICSKDSFCKALKIPLANDEECREDSQCTSKKCVGRLCKDDLSDTFEFCLEDKDCKTSACGGRGVNFATNHCCLSKEAMKDGICTMVPIGASCPFERDDKNDFCVSENCTDDGKCVAK